MATIQVATPQMCSMLHLKTPSASRQEWQTVEHTWGWADRATPVRGGSPLQSDHAENVSPSCPRRTFPVTASSIRLPLTASLTL